MAILTTGNTFVDGNQVTATTLNAAVNSSTFAAGAVDTISTSLSSGAIIVKDGGITAAKISTGGPVWDANGLTGLTVRYGSATAIIPTGYAANISNRTNAVTQHGLVLGTSYQNATSIVFNAGSYNPSGGAFTSYLRIEGDGQVYIPVHDLHLDLTKAVYSGYIDAAIQVKTPAYYSGDNKVVGAQAAAETNVSVTSSITGSDTVDAAVLLAAVAALQNKVNALLAMLRTHGLIAT
jgi:hypothetical protein